MTGVPDAPQRRSLLKLISDLPTLVTDLIRGELDSLKTEMTAKLKQAGIGAGLLVGAALFGFIALLVFVAAAVLGLAEVLPAWASALIVGAIILIVAVVLALLGIKRLQKGVPPAPTETIKSIKKDVGVIKGTGNRESHE